MNSIIFAIEILIVITCVQCKSLIALKMIAYRKKKELLQGFTKQTDFQRCCCSRFIELLILINNKEKL